MAKRANIVGIEIEPGAVHAAAVSVNGRIKIEAAAMAPLATGVIRDGEVNDAEALSTALRSLYAANKGLGKHVRIGIANQKIVVRVIELPPIEDEKQLEAAVRFQAPEEIPMPLDSAVMDFQPLGIVDTDNGPRQRVLIVAARRDMVERVLGAVRAAGLKPEGIDLAAFAMVRALNTPGDMIPTLYLSIGGLTNLAVAVGTDCLFTRVVGGGVESIAVELAERRGLTLEHARGWLAHVGIEEAEKGELSDIEAEIAQDARAVLTDGVRRIGGEVRNSLDFHHSQESGQAPSVQRAVLTGAAAVVPGFADALSVELGMPVTTGVVAGTPGDVELPVLTVAAGLAVEEAPSA
jgi:type IV pilus assembly protein PilM